MEIIDRGKSGEMDEAMKSQSGLPASENPPEGRVERLPTITSTGEIGKAELPKPQDEPGEIPDIAEEYQWFGVSKEALGKTGLGR